MKLGIMILVAKFHMEDNHALGEIQNLDSEI